MALIRSNKSGGGSPSLGTIDRTLSGSAGAHAVSVTSGKYYLFIVYSSAVDRYISITSGATVINTEPTTPSDGINVTLVLATAGTIDYSIVSSGGAVQVAMVEVELN